MITLPYRYVLEFSRTDGSSVGRAAATTVDWLPAVEHAHFEAICHGKLPATTVVPPARIEPVWDEAPGPPYVRAFRVCLGATGTSDESGPSDHSAPAGPSCMAAEVAIDYFADCARELSRRFVKDGRLKAGDRYRYRVTAMPDDDASRRSRIPGSPSRKTGFTVESVERPLTLGATSRTVLDGRAVEVGDSESGDPPVYIPLELIEEARALVREADQVETGGILIGHLHREPDDVSAGVHLELTAQIPAEHVQRESTRLSFTPDTWAAARAALELRRAGEIILGWWHSHPDWCRDCDADRRASCSLNGIFFSSDDVAVHRTVFPRAFHVALLLTHRGEDITPSVFGWRRGRVTARGFHLLGRGDATPPILEIPPNTPTIGGDEHASAHDS